MTNSAAFWRGFRRGYIQASRWLLLPAVAIGTTILAARACAQEEPPATGRVSVGAVAVWGERTDVAPGAIVEAEAPINLGRASVARVLAQLKATGVQSEGFELGNVATFGAIALEVYVERRIGGDEDGGATYIHAHGGGATLRDSDGREPYQRSPLWYSVGVTLERRAGGAFPHRRLSVGFGHSDVSSPPRRSPGTLAAAARDAKPRDLIVSGSVAIDGPGRVEVILSGDCHRGLWGPRATTQARIASTVTWGART